MLVRSGGTARRRRPDAGIPGLVARWDTYQNSCYAAGTAIAYPGACGTNM